MMMTSSSYSSKMKRKELDEVNDDFSDFSLSSPARKIRRLDAELPPILEEDELQIPPAFHQQYFHESNVGGSVVIDELPEKNEERAIVLFKPMNDNPFLHSPPTFSVSSDILSGLKNQDLWSKQSGIPKTSEDKSEGQGEPVDASNDCLAVVPWVQPHLSPAQSAQVQQPVFEMMEAEEMEVASMDIEEENCNGVEPGVGSQFGGVGASEGLHKWQQQHCMVPQPPQNASTPIVWFR